jgi:chaperonin GroES
MAIKKLLSFIGKDNIADEFDEDQLKKCAERVKRQFDQDLESMTDWMNSVEMGLELMKPEFKGKSSPWEGASNYKDPLLTEAAVKFGDKANVELLRPPELVGSAIIGEDKEKTKAAKGKRVALAMNYQINHDMNDWRDEQARLFYNLPNTGCVFKKTIYNPSQDRCESHTIQYPDFAVNQATKSMETCRSFSQVLDFSKNDVFERVNSGTWLDIGLYDNDDSDGDKDSNEEQEVVDSTDNGQRYIEQQTFYDFDGDGYEEPYTITIHESTKEVVRIVARFDENSIFVDLADMSMPLPKAIEIIRQQEQEAFGGTRGMELLGMSSQEPDTASLDIIKIVPFQQITKYGFMTAPDGTFLDLGYAHTLGPIVMALNSTTNQLTDRGTLNNLGGGFLAKEFRKSMGISRLKMGQYMHTDVPAEKLQKGIFSNPIQEPSQTLFGLNQEMFTRGQSLLAVVDFSGQIQPNTPPTTALAIIQEGLIPTTAHFKRIIAAQSSEFRILFRLNQRTFSEDKYKKILQDDQANAQDDFNTEGLDMVPTSNAEMASKTQRIQTAQIQMEQFDRVLQTGGNPVPLVKNYFESIGSSILQEIYPKEGSMSPAEMEQMKKMQEGQDLQNQIAQQQLQILEREQTRLDKDTEAKVRKVSKEIELMGTEMQENLTKAMLNAEQAESEQVKNAISTYSAGLKGQLDTLTAIGAEDDRRSAKIIELTNSNQQRSVQ